MEHDVKTGDIVLNQRHSTAISVDALLGFQLPRPVFRSRTHQNSGSNHAERGCQIGGTFPRPSIISLEYQKEAILRDRKGLRVQAEDRAVGGDRTTQPSQQRTDGAQSAHIIAKTAPLTMSWTGMTS